MASLRVDVDVVADMTKRGGGGNGVKKPAIRWKMPDQTQILGTTVFESVQMICLRQARSTVAFKVTDGPAFQAQRQIPEGEAHPASQRRRDVRASFSTSIRRTAARRCVDICLKPVTRF